MRDELLDYDWDRGGIDEVYGNKMFVSPQGCIQELYVTRIDEKATKLFEWFILMIWK